MVIPWLLFIIGVGAFVGGAYFTGKEGVAREKKVSKERHLFETLSLMFLAAGAVICFFSISLAQKSSIGRVGTPTNLDKATFYRALGTGETLKGDKFVNVQNAMDEIFTITSEIQPRRGTFLRVTPTGKDLEIVEPNNTSPK